MPLNLPNALTLLRIALVPVMVVGLLSESTLGFAVAIAAFVTASATDGLDGHLARSQSNVTRLGTVLDPIADKLLIGAALLCLVVLDRLWLWVAIVIIGRELAVSALRAVVSRDGVSVPSSLLGKAKTVVQIAMVFTLILATDAEATPIQALVYLTVAITVLSGLDYFLSARREMAARGAAADARPARP